MKLTSKRITLLLALLLPILPVKSMAETPPASTYQPGFWQPIARFNPKKTVEVQLINKTELLLEYDLTDLESMNPQQLDPQQTTTLKNFGDTAYIVVYPKTSGDPDNPMTLKFSVNVDNNNLVQVTIEKSEPSFLGHRVVNLQKSGAIFLY
ncbi:conserved hypothetical protein [Rippkaea orientalis PCC 8801]|uniref:Uncharacterized protein n=1 Tax=Rippkaea orientalis (strain PCC 8801 / RF-1) TaxID=41431 RepID=B7JUF6_RIPO1|nr:hypothetical protein [Rippkaea orientalis]ACK64536.1 conserved hypothetical protein [Rippkaea orientalis PCC 8801]